MDPAVKLAIARAILAIVQLVLLIAERT